jgi:hypothetical protein
VVIANIWQVLLSLAYILNNGLLSSQLVADEWAGFADERKTLRVSNPMGIQRSNYFISMPLRYGLPIMALFSIEHWLLSQAMFLIRVIEFISVDDGFIAEESTTSGFSMAPALLGELYLFISYSFSSLCLSPELLSLPQNRNIVLYLKQSLNENSDYSFGPTHCSSASL